MAKEVLTLGIRLKPVLDATGVTSVAKTLTERLGAIGRSVKPLVPSVLETPLKKVAAVTENVGNSFKGLWNRVASGASQSAKAIEEVGKSGGRIKGIIDNALGTAGGIGLSNLAGGVIDVAKKMVSGNAEMERYETQLGTLLGSADLAKTRLAELAKFGAETPFELPELAAAEKVLIGFGLQGQKAIDLTGKTATQLRTVIGDISAGVGVPFQELAVTFGKLSAGATGEAIARLQELGIVTKEQLKNVGIAFDKAGSLVSPLPDAMTAAVKIAEEKFGGGMEQLSKTFEGQVSTLSDTITQGLNLVGAPLFAGLKEGLGSLLSTLGTDEFQASLTSLGQSLSTVIVPVFQTLPTVIKAGLGAFNTFVPILGDIVELATELGPVIISVAGGWKLFSSASQIAAVATRTLGGALVANPVGLAVTAIAGLVVGLKALAAAFHDTAEEQLEQAQAQEQIIRKDREAVVLKIEQVTQTGELADEYERLGSKVERSADEEKRLDEIKRQLNGTYPGLIKNTATFGENLDVVKSQAAGASGVISDLEKDLAKLDKRLAESAQRQAELKSFIAKEGIESALTDARANFLTGASEAVFGTSTARQQAEEFIKPFTDQIFKATESGDLDRIGENLKRAAIKEFEIEPKDELAFRSAVDQFIASRKSYLDFAFGRTTAVPDVPVDTTAATKAATSATDDLKKLREQLAKELEKAGTDARIAAVNEERARQIKALDESTAAEIADTKETYAKLGKGNADVITLLGLREAAALRERNELIAGLIQEGIDSEKIAFEEGIKGRLDVLKAEEELTTGTDPATLKRAGELRREQIGLNFELELGVIVRTSERFQAAFSELDTAYLNGEIDAAERARRLATALQNALPDLTGLQATVTELGAKTLEGTIQPEEFSARVREAAEAATAAVGATEQERLAILRLVLAQEKLIVEERRAIREKELAFELALAELLGTEPERARAKALTSARADYESRLKDLDDLETELEGRFERGQETEATYTEKLSALNTAREKARRESLALAYDAEQEFAEQTNVLISAAASVRLGIEAAVTKGLSDEQQKRIDDERASIATRKEELFQSYKEGSITVETYYSKLDELRKKHTDLVEQSEAQRVTVTRIALTGLAAAAADFEQKKTDLIAGGIDNLTSLAKAGLVGTADFGTQQLELLTQYGQRALAQTIGALGTMLQEGNVSLKKLGNIVLNQLYSLAESQITIFTPVITAQAAALLGPIFGPIAATALIASIKVGLGAAKGVLALNRGGVVPGNDPSVGDVVPAMLTPTERVFNPVTSRRERQLFDALQSGEPSENYFVKKYGRLLVDTEGRLVAGAALQEAQQTRRELHESIQTLRTGLNEIAEQQQAVAKRFSSQTAVTHTFGNAKVSGRDIAIAIERTETDNLSLR